MYFPRPTSTSNIYSREIYSQQSGPVRKYFWCRYNIVILIIIIVVVLAYLWYQVGNSPCIPSNI
jgi:hypothetical protein